MSSESYKEILELAVLEACEDEIERLNKLEMQAGVDEFVREQGYEKTQLSEDESDLAYLAGVASIACSVSHGLGVLGSLSTGDKPDYDLRWIPLLHASWYHLRHVNFLQNELAARLKRHANSDVIRVTDFGCGTMPVMWAIALVLADPKNELTNQKVSVYNYDTSEAMKKMGKDMRAKLIEVVKSRQDLDRDGRLFNALGRVTESTKKFYSDAHLLTAIHCIYDEETCGKIKKTPITDRLVTLHRGKADDLELKDQTPVSGKWSGNLDKLTEFRKETIGSLCQHSYLSRPVKWNNRDVVRVNL